MVRKYIFFLLSGFSAIYSFAQPANDNCSNATPVSIPNSGNICVNGTLAGATDNGSFSTCELAGSAEVWFTYIAAGSNNTVTVSPSGASPAANLVVTVTSSACGINTFSTCNAAATANGTATASWAFPQGTQVWIFISSSSGSTGTFQVCVNSINIPPSTGKDCSTAAPICNLNSFSAPVAAGSNGFQPPCFQAALQQPLIYQFTVAQTGLLNWLATPVCGAPHANATEFDWAVYDITSGCPGSVVACNYNYTGFIFGPVTTPEGMQGGPGAGCFDTSITGSTAFEICPGVTVTAGRTYIIILDQYTTGNSCNVNFNFTGSTFLPAPSSVFTINPASGCGTVTAAFNNTSLGASGYTWNFGDGTTSTSQNPPAKTYSSSGTFLVSLTTSAASGCTDVTSQSVQVSPNPSVTVSNDTICAGLQATLTATPAITGGTYSWSPGGFNTQSISVSPAITTTYTVTYTLNGCQATSTGVVNVNTGTFTVNAGNDTVVCANQTIRLNGQVLPSGNYTYQWSPAGGLTNANTLTPSATPVSNSVYLLSVTDAGGCIKTDSVAVTVNGIAVPVNISGAPLVICPGQPVQLDANVTPAFCGPAVACAVNDTSGPLGSGNLTQPGTATQPPTILGNFNKSGRNQMLFLASELNSALGGPCILKNISFSIAIFNSTAILQNFTVKMACTNASSLNTWENNLVTVCAPFAMQPRTGSGSNATFTTPFAWDGTSNLIVDVCWYNPSTFGTQNNKAVCTTTAFNSYLCLVSNNDLCGTSNPPAVSTLRPNIRFNYCVPDINDYNIVWSPASGVNSVSNPAISNPTANPQSTTNYNISVSGGGCAGTNNITIQVDGSTVSAGADQNSCPGTLVPLSASVTGALIPGPATFSWSTLGGTNMGSTQSINVSPTVTTTFVVAMSGGACVKRDTVRINISGLGVNTAVSNVTCQGANNGKIKVTSSGSAPYSFSWSVNSNTGNIDSAINLSPGLYAVTVTDAGGCSGSASVQITEPTALSFAYVVTPVSCNGGNNGSISINPSGGTPGYTYQWSNGLPALPSNNSLSAGNYSVTVRDTLLCSATGAIIVPEPSAIVFSPATIVNVRCFNGNTGSITVSAAGGTGAYRYSWSHNAGLNSALASGLVAGAYTVTISDSLNCTASATYNIAQPPGGLIFNAPVVIEPSCYGGSNGSATVNPGGGVMPYTYLWFPSNQITQTASGLSAQTYFVTVTDDSLCTAIDTIVVNQPPSISIAGNVVDVSCNGNSDASIDITVSNGNAPYTYQWSDGSTTQDLINIIFGTYMIIVTDNLGCTQADTFLVTEPPVLVLNAPVITHVLCFGENTGSITANPAGGFGSYNYLWSPSGNSQTISTLIAGNYSLTLSDAHGCSVTAVYVVTEPAAPLIFGAPVIVDVLCNGLSTGSITVSITGGTAAYHYSWSHNSTLDNPAALLLSAGTYMVTATDANGCSLTATNTILQPAPITFGAPDITNVSCFGAGDGSAQITPSGGTGNFSYTWNGVTGSNPQGSLVPGTYTVVVTDGNNCAASTTIDIIQPAQLTVQLTPHDATCFGARNGYIEASPIGGTPGYSYLWTSGSISQNAMGLGVGQYSVIVTDSRGCSISSDAVVNEPSQILFTLRTTQVRCPGERNGTITMIASGGTPPYTISATQDGSNFVYATNDTIIGLATGYYTVIIADYNGCTLVDTAFVPPPVPDVYNHRQDSTSCYGSQYRDGAVHVEGLTIQNMPYEFSVDGGAFGFSGDFYDLAAGNHLITARNYWGCTTDIPVIVPEPAEGIAEVLPHDTIIQLGQTVPLSSSISPFPSSSIVSWLWTPSSGLSCIDCPNPLVQTYNRFTQYTVTIIYNEHCIARASMTILLEDTLKVFIPNSFSPNGDGNNDLWKIYGEGIKNIDLKIFNRWGEKVYETSNQFDGWDGTYRGQLQNPSVFVYEARITFLNDRAANRVGSISLVR